MSRRQVSIILKVFSYFARQWVWIPFSLFYTKQKSKARCLVRDGEPRAPGFLGQMSRGLTSQDLSHHPTAKHMEQASCGSQGQSGVPNASCWCSRSEVKPGKKFHRFNDNNQGRQSPVPGGQACSGGAKLRLGCHVRQGLDQWDHGQAQLWQPWRWIKMISIIF